MKPMTQLMPSMIKAKTPVKKGGTAHKIMSAHQAQLIADHLKAQALQKKQPLPPMKAVDPNWQTPGSDDPTVDDEENS